VGFGGLDQAVRGGPRLLTATGERQRPHEDCPGDPVGVATACELGAAPLDASFGLADGRVHSARQALEAERHLVAATADHQLGGVAVADRLPGPSGVVALRRQHVQERQSGMVDRAGGLDELLGPGYRLVIVDPKAEERRVGGEGGGDIQVAPVGGPPKRGAQIGQLHAEPPVGLPLPGAVPQSEDVGFAPGQVAGAPLATSCSSANWRIVSSIENRVRPEDRSATSSDLRTKASSRSMTA
jgi:hypothetical protein